MTAALYALRNGKSALVIEKNGFGVKIFDTAKDAANKMRAIMLERRNQGDAATAQRLAGIMVTLGDAVKEAAK